MGLKLGITMLLNNKDDIQFVTEFLCFFGTLCITTINYFRRHIFTSILSPGKYSPMTKFANNYTLKRNKHIVTYIS